MKISIVGGSGFIGTKLIGSLNSKHTVTNIDKNISDTYPELTKNGDVREKDKLQSLLDGEYCVLLAAEHRDDVSPTSLYYDVNVEGTTNIINVMEARNIKNIIFTSTVAVYGLNKNNPDEEHPVDPFNHYGKSKWQAEELLRAWHKKDPENRTLIIIRPTVVFGPGNRGNVYNLLRQISVGKFMMIGSGTNKKSMAYVENVVAFIAHCIDSKLTGYHVYNYADKPDLTMNELVKQAEVSIKKSLSPIRIPYAIGYLGGKVFDVVAKLTNKKLPISSVRVKKFCATTQFSADKVSKSGFIPPLTLNEGLDKTIKSILEDQNT